jgi:hypothetical protein
VTPGTPWQLAAELTVQPEDQGKWLKPLGEFLKKGYPRGRFTGSIFASEAQGDYLLWALPPEYPVFFYTHVHLFTAEHWDEAQRVKEGAKGWKAILDRNGVNLIVVEPERAPQLRALLHKDPDWVVILDETGNTGKLRSIDRVLITLRKVPVQKTER